MRPVFYAYGPCPFAPANMRYAAAMHPQGPGTHWMATGETPEAALAKLEALWDRSIDKRKGPRKPTSEPVVCAADDDVII